MPPHLPAEWHAIDGVLLAWPDHAEIWEPELPLRRVQQAHLAILRELTTHTRVLVVTGDPDAVHAAADGAGIDTARLQLHCVPTNDIWIRDYGPITVLEDGQPRLLDYQYNGWGLKYPADRDNGVTRQLHEAGIFGGAPREQMPIVLEGGSIDSDGQGCLLTTRTCLLSPNRNPHLDEAAITRLLREQLGSREIIWLREGWLAGDDTDAHVDMLARFAPGGRLVYSSCDDSDDVHAGPLGRLAEELSALDRWELLPLPIPAPIHAPDGRRLPASYANFLALPRAVLVPQYGDPRTDALAIATLAEAFPDHAISGLDCLPLIHQHGSLHCATMQLPAGTLPPTA